MYFSMLIKCGLRSVGLVIWTQASSCLLLAPSWWQDMLIMCTFSYPTNRSNPLIQTPNSRNEKIIDTLWITVRKYHSWKLSPHEIGCCFSQAVKNPYAIVDRVHLGIPKYCHVGYFLTCGIVVASFVHCRFSICLLIIHCTKRPCSDSLFVAYFI